jgi:hypothetical protein
MRFWLSGPRLFRGMVRPGISFGPEDLRSLGIAGSVVLVIAQVVLAIVFAGVAAFGFYITYLIATNAF